MDESRFYLLPGCVRTYAPRACTPVLRILQTRDHLSVMSAITLTGGLFSLIRAEALTGVESILFLKHLLTHLDRRLLVIWDGSPIHRSQPVKDFLANGGTRHVHLERLPSYAPDLNPDEGTWQHLKPQVPVGHVELRNVCCHDLNHLHRELTLALRRLRRRPALIQSFFAGAGLAI